MSSHREAPGISKDPVADSTDVYAFVSPDKPGTVKLCRSGRAVSAVLPVPGRAAQRLQHSRQLTPLDSPAPDAGTR